jgi:uncharacterized membrane protein YbaN (DUF454 family)
MRWVRRGRGDVLKGYTWILICVLWYWRGADRFRSWLVGPPHYSDWIKALLLLVASLIVSFLFTHRVVIGDRRDGSDE